MENDHEQRSRLRIVGTELGGSCFLLERSAAAACGGYLAVAQRTGDSRFARPEGFQ